MNNTERFAVVLEALVWIVAAIIVGVLLFGAVTASADVRIGTPGNDTLYGTDGDDTIRGRAGDDTIIAGRGSDNIYPGHGDDTVRCGRGFDVILVNGDPDTDGDDTYRNCEAIIPA